MTDVSADLADGARADAVKRSFGRRFARVVGLSLVVVSLLATIIAFAILMGFTPFEPNEKVTRNVAMVIAGLILCLCCSVGWEIYHLWRARQKRRAAARLHIRIVSLFALIAAVPAIIVAIVASVTLDIGLDRWFSDRTQRIVASSVTVARAYLDEHARFLAADIDAVARDYRRLNAVLRANPNQRVPFLTTQARIRNLPLLKVIDGEGNELLSANIGGTREWPQAPQDALNDAANNFEQVPVLISPGRTENLVGAIIRVSARDNEYLYAIRAVDSQVISYLREAEQNAAEYSALRQSQTGTQIAFALLYLGVAIVLLVSSIWLAINFADGLVRPIRNLMNAASSVSKGDLSVQVPVKPREGDIGLLSETFNVMTAQLDHQRKELLSANDQLDMRRRFIETVLSGVSAGVMGISSDGKIEVANRFALKLLDVEEHDVIDRTLGEAVPELTELLNSSVSANRTDHRAQITLIRKGMERTVNARLTAEFAHGVRDGFVLTLDDITDLVTAQRTSAWADVARRIAHEIKNPLTPIQLSAERLRRRFGKGLEDKDLEVFEKCTDTIVRQVGDIGRMVDEFSSFARMPKPTFEKADLRDCLKEAVFLREVAQPNVKYSLDVPDKPMTGYFDQRLFSQVLTNLIKNAGEAIEGRVGEEGAGSIQVTGREEAGLLIVEIIDDGKGWPQENRHQLLEPYMTTRKKGTGLGLAIVVKVVEDHKGRFELLDAPDFAKKGYGAMVRITIPVEQTGSSKSLATAPRPQGTEKDAAVEPV